MQICLVIDDSPVIRKVARVIIEGLRLEVREAEDGRQAYEMCAIEMPDVILLDWHLPVMGPFDFMRALKLFGPRKWPHIIYCTTELDFVDVRRAREAGAADVLLKPFDREALLSKFASFHNVLALKEMALMQPGDAWPESPFEHLETA